MPFLGIDQSLGATGVCLVDGAGKVLHIATLNPGKLRGGARLAFIRDQIFLLVKAGTLVAMEGYAYDATNKAFLLGEVGGVVQLVMHDVEAPLLVVAPAALKKFATSDARADKAKMISRAQQLGCATTDDNQADAFFLARVAWLSSVDLPFAVSLGANRAQLEVIHALKNKKIKIGKRNMPIGKTRALTGGPPACTATQTVP